MHLFPPQKPEVYPRTGIYLAQIIWSGFFRRAVVRRGASGFCFWGGGMPVLSWLFALRLSGAMECNFKDKVLLGQRE